MHIAAGVVFGLVAGNFLVQAASAGDYALAFDRSVFGVASIASLLVAQWLAQWGSRQMGSGSGYHDDPPISGMVEKPKDAEPASSTGPREFGFFIIGFVSGAVGGGYLTLMWLASGFAL